MYVWYVFVYVNLVKDPFENESIQNNNLLKETLTFCFVYTYVSFRGRNEPCSEDVTQLQSSLSEEEAGNASDLWRLQEEDRRGKSQTVQTHTVR